MFGVASKDVKLVFSARILFRLSFVTERICNYLVQRRKNKNDRLGNESSQRLFEDCDSRFSFNAACLEDHRYGNYASGGKEWAKLVTEHIY